MGAKNKALSEAGQVTTVLLNCKCFGVKWEMIEFDDSWNNKNMELKKHDHYFKGIQYWIVLHSKKYIHIYKQF